MSTAAYFSGQSLALGVTWKEQCCVPHSYLLPTLSCTVDFVTPMTSLAITQSLGCMPRDCTVMESLLLVAKAWEAVLSCSKFMCSHPLLIAVCCLSRTFLFYLICCTRAGEQYRCNQRICFFLSVSGISTHL
jgi:hypothetical protein